MEDLAKAVISYFSAKGITVTLNGSCFEVSATADGQEYSFVCSLDENFPYVLPKIQLGEAAKHILSGRPHVFIGDVLCTFGSDVVSPNFYRPDLIIIATIEKAISILLNANQENDEEAFNDEFKAYWEGKIKDSKVIHLFVEDLSSCQTLFCYENEGIILVSESNTRVLEIARRALEHGGNPEIVYPALLLPINSLTVARTASTQKEWYDVVKKHSNYIAQYCAFLRKNSRREALIIFTSPLNERWIPCGFKHTILGDRPNFRNGHTPVPLVLAGPEGELSIKKIVVRDCSQTRLFMRGSIGRLFPVNNVGIIGCGSLGSHLVNAFADCGLSQFSLFDYECLSVDNIARHICGYSYVGLLKTTAIKLYLGLKNPNISCECNEDNIHTILQTSVELLNECDAIFVTTADIAIDAHIISCLSQRTLKKPVIIMWLEPYAIAAHVLVLQKPQDIFTELYDGQFNYKYSVLQNASDYQKRDAGCQATYIQYSSLHVEMFICSFLDYLFSNNIFLTNSNYRFFWLGSLGIADKFHLEINDHYRDLHRNTLYSEIISDV